MNSISIIGTGYVGLVTGTCLSEFGIHVICMDVDASKIQILSRGEVPIYEPGLGRLLAKNLEAGRLRFTTDIAETVSESDMVFIAVGTPPGEDGSVDMTHVLSAAELIAAHMNDYRIIVNKSTVPVGTARRIKDAIVILTEWNQFRHLDLPRLRALMAGQHFFDFRNVYEPRDMAGLGFIYSGVGR